MAQIFLVDKVQVGIHITVSIQINVTVGGMIVFFMECFKPLLGQIRDKVGISAGFIGIRGIRIQGFLNFCKKNLLRRGISSFHFIIYNAFVSKRLILILQFVMPALLHHGFRLGMETGIKNSVQIDVHQIGEILIIAAGNGIYGFIRIGDGIQESIERAFDKFNKRFPQGKLPGTAQHRMFHNMRYSRVVRRRCAKRYGEYFIVVIVLQIEQPGAALFMKKQVCGGI